MGLAAYQFRTTFRRRAGRLIGVALLVGLAGGLALFAFAGARRTQSSYPRFLRSVNASTMAIDAGRPLDPDTARLLDTVAHLPQVRQARSYGAFDVIEYANGRPDLTKNYEALGSLDGRYFDQDRFAIIHGRRPDPRRIDEVAVNEQAAERYHYRVGQRLGLATYDDADVSEYSGEGPPPKPKFVDQVTIVGIGAFPEEVVQDDADHSVLMLLTPAYSKRSMRYVTYSWMGLVLRGGDADVKAVKAAILDLVPTGFPQFFRTTSVDTFHALQAVRPLAIALALFGAIAAAAALLLAAQTLSRQVRLDRQERFVLRALGASPWTIARAMLLMPLMAIAVGTALALCVAALASPLMPIGPMRRVEIARGLDFDWTVLGLGAAVFVGVLAAVTCWSVWREVRAGGRAPKRARRPRIVAAATSTNLPPSIKAGLRLALERGEGATAVPVRSVIGGTATAIAALVAALTFGASMHNLVTEPRLFGWNWDAALTAEAGYGNIKLAAARDVLDRKAGVRAWSGAFFGSDVIDGLGVPLLGMTPGAAVTPPIVEGHGLQRRDEVVLGAATLASLHKRVGDTVFLGTGRGHRLRVVGTATFPTVGVVHGAHTSLGVGALVDRRLVPGYDRAIENSPARFSGPAETFDDPNVIFVRFRDGIDAADATRQLRKVKAPLEAYPGYVIVDRVLRPAEIVNTSEVGRAPAFLGAMLAAAALISLGLALGTAVRRRRRDLALLKALGFTRRQTSVAVAWQATVTITLGLAFGIPAGVLVGRLTWTLFADQLDVLARPATPVAGIAVVVVGAVVAANLAAAVPARMARRLDAPRMLQSE